MKKQLWKDIIAGIISILVSGFIFSGIFSYFRIFSYVGITGWLALEIVFAYVLFMAYRIVVEKRGKRKLLAIFMFLYIGMFIALLFSRNSPAYGVNMKVGYINDFAPYVLWANLLILLPVGLLLKYLYDAKWYAAFPAALGAVTMLETFQFLFRRGCLDINDILLNTMGFGIGFIICSVYNGIKTKHSA